MARIFLASAAAAVLMTTLFAAFARTGSDVAKVFDHNVHPPELANTENA